MPTRTGSTWVGSLAMLLRGQVRSGPRCVAAEAADYVTAGFLQGTGYATGSLVVDPEYRRDRWLNVLVRNVGVLH